jgi:hypothetical protein
VKTAPAPQNIEKKINGALHLVAVDTRKYSRCSDDA